MNVGLDAVEVREITVQRTFADFDDFWTTSMMAATVSQTIAAMAPHDAESLKTRMCTRLPALLPDASPRCARERDHGARAKIFARRRKRKLDSSGPEGSSINATR
jgi:hypothetical protein